MTKMPKHARPRQSAQETLVPGGPTAGVPRHMCSRLADGEKGATGSLAIRWHRARKVP